MVGFCIILSVRTVADMFSSTLEASFPPFYHLCGKPHQLPSLPQPCLAPRWPWENHGACSHTQIHGCRPWEKNVVAIILAQELWLQVEQGKAVLPAWVQKVPYSHPLPSQNTRKFQDWSTRHHELSNTLEQNTSQRGNRKYWIVNFDPFSGYLSLRSNTDQGTSDWAE